MPLPPTTTTTTPRLSPPLATRVDALVTAGVADAAGLAPDAFADLAAGLPEAHDALFAVHPDLVPASVLAPLLRRGSLPGFVVPDMTDVDSFAPISQIRIPDRPLYLVHDLTRGDDLRGRTPDDALPHLLGEGRSPLTLTEGLSWLLQQPDILQPNACFMTIGSRLVRPGERLDARTPAVWIASGTERDGGRDRRGAPKVGWCWAGNHHPWLGHASASRRSG